MKRNSLYIYTAVFVTCIIGYLLIIINMPPDASVLTRYNLSPSQARFLSLSIAAPLIIIWTIALFGLISINRYATHIRKDKDGRAFTTISRGLSVLVFSLPLVAFISSGLSYIARTSPEFTPKSVIVTNYITLATFFTAFFIIRKGAMRLNSKIKNRDVSDNYRFWRFGLVALGLLFTYMTLNNPARAVAPPGASRAVYYLPDWLIVITIIVPYIINWYLGMQSAYYIRQYSKRVPGILYRVALGYISNGIGAVILASILIRFLVSTTEFFNKAGLRLLLFVVYLLLITMSIGYILIALGAKKLQKIEEA